MEENQDPNLKNAEMTSKLVALQDTVREYQEKLKLLNEKVYKCKYHGIEMQMKGDFTIVSVIIDQGAYETSSKGNLEQLIFTCLTNLKKAISDEQDSINNELQELVQEYNIHNPLI